MLVQQYLPNTEEQRAKPLKKLVELKGIEPLTFTVRLQRNGTSLSVFRHYLAEKFAL